jgi:hypothetical protein
MLYKHPQKSCVVCYQTSKVKVDPVGCHDINGVANYFAFRNESYHLEESYLMVVGFPSHHCIILVKSTIARAFATKNQKIVDFS